jgi:hypothetical protein
MSNKWTRNQKILVIGVIVSIGMLFAQVWSLGKRIQPVIEMKPQIVNVINNITKVEKEIANIKEVIHQQYAAFKTEDFRKADLGKRIAIYPNPLSPEDSVIFFELQYIPVENSIQIVNSYGVSAPAITYELMSNIILLRVRDIKPDNFMKDDKEVYAIKYIPDTMSNKRMDTIKELKIDKVNITLHPKS